MTPSELTFEDSASFDVPETTVETAITPINVSTGVSGGTQPYTFSATGLPAWLTLSSSEGIITGTAPALAAEATTATITVTDANGDSKSITISIGAVVDE